MNTNQQPSHPQKDEAIAYFMAIKNPDGTIYKMIEEDVMEFNTPNLPLNYMYPIGHVFHNQGNWSFDYGWIMPVWTKISHIRSVYYAEINQRKLILSLGWRRGSW